MKPNSIRLIRKNNKIIIIRDGIAEEIPVSEMLPEFRVESGYIELHKSKIIIQKTVTNINTIGWKDNRTFQNFRTYINIIKFEKAEG